MSDISRMEEIPRMRKCLTPTLQHPSIKVTRSDYGVAYWIEVTASLARQMHYFRKIKFKDRRHS